MYYYTLIEHKWKHTIYIACVHFKIVFICSNLLGIKNGECLKVMRPPSVYVLVSVVPSSALPLVSELSSSTITSAVT